MLSSLPEATTTQAQVNKAIADLESRLGVTVQTVSSSAYDSLTSGYDGCVGRYFSSDRADFELDCHFSDPQRSPHCVRP